MIDLPCVLIKKDPGVESKIWMPRRAWGIFHSSPWDRALEWTASQREENFRKQDKGQSPLGGWH